MSVIVPVALIVGGGAAVVVGGLSARSYEPADDAVPARIPLAHDAGERRALLSAVAGASGFLLGALLWFAVGYSFVLGMAGCALLTTVGALAPSAHADRQVRKRLHIADCSVADLAGLLSVELRSGIGVDAAIENVAGELSGVLADEVQNMTTQVRYGMARTQALESLRSRLPAPNVERLVQSLQHAGELGAPVADTLDKLADDCTTRRFQQVREDAAKLPVKLLFPILFCIFPPMLVVLVGPAMVDIAKALG